jgi:hypothetical protein
MFDLEPIFEFSRNHCVAICACLVPANLLATINTLVLSATAQPLAKMGWSLAIAATLAITLFLHVSTWFVIGVITPVTFILFGLGTSCLLINILAVIYRNEFPQLITLAKSSLLVIAGKNS